MKKILFIAATIFFLFGIAESSNAALTKSGRWLYRDGTPVYLIGYDLQQLFAEVSYSEADVKVKIDALASYGVTGFRVWVNNWFRKPTGTIPSVTNPELKRAIFPFAYNSSTNKFDLNTWNDAYFTRYKNLLTYAKSKGMTVEVSIFSEYPELDASHNYWSNTTRSNYWLYTTDPAMAGNSNGFWSNVAGTYNDLYPEFYQQTFDSGNLFTKQKSLASKVIDEFNPIGNVFFQVHNEWPPKWNVGGNGSTSCTGTNAACSPFCFTCGTSEIDSRYTWQQDMADYFHNTKGAITSVTAHFFAGRNLQGIQYWKDRPSIDILSFHPYITDSDPNNIPSTVTSFFSSLQNTGKILLSDEGTALDDIPDLVTQEMWAHFVNGAYYFAYQDNPFDVNAANAGRIKTLSEISKLVDWPNMMYGKKSLITSGPGTSWEAMSKAGEYYVAFFTGTKSSTAASISLPNGTYNYKWYDTRAWNSNGIASGQITSSGTASISAPAIANWSNLSGVALVIDKVSNTAPSAPQGLSVR